jgi:hypothetical protein
VIGSRWSRAATRWPVRSGEGRCANFCHQPVLVPCYFEAALTRLVSWQAGKRSRPPRFSPHHTFAGFPDEEMAYAYIAAKLGAIRAA